MTVPFDPEVNRFVEIKADETAHVSIATTETDLPLENWLAQGWTLGDPLAAYDDIPADCALHFRTGQPRQVYAVCAGPATVAMPTEGGDFVYVVFTNNDNRIARIIQTGAKYNPDATGLIP